MFFKKPQFIERDFQPILLGANLNSYSLAREFHEQYKVKSIVVGKFNTVQIIDSQLLEFIKVKDFDIEERVVAEVNKLAKKYEDKKIILLGCSDTLLQVIMRNKSNFGKNVITPYIEIEQAEQLMNKDSFAKIAKEYDLPMPETFIHEKGMGDKYELDFSFPIVLKPSDQPQFFAKKFAGQKKVYIINDRVELEKEMKKIYNSGYRDSLIVQEYIPGDDSAMYVLNSYSDRNGKVTMMSFANILLEEHTPTARGNHAAIINSYDEKMFKLVKNFLEQIEFTGFSNFDIKYDKRDNTFKFFEMNVRQGNSHYHVTAAGVNVTEFLIEDRVYGIDKELSLVKDKNLFMIVPNVLALWYVKYGVKRREMLRLIAKGKTVNPLYNFSDMTFKRLFYLELNYFGHFIKFFKYFKRYE
jgi:D-aspartate ligase